MQESQYLDLIKKILLEGELRLTRNSTTKSIFGEKLEFDISKSVPFVTTKKLAWKTVIRELLWFLSGSTDNQKLLDQNVFIWQGNASREFMDSLGFHDRDINDLGPVYGHQWRHFGTKYINHRTDYFKKGVDQIQMVIDQLRNDRTSRRIILNAWNPADLHLMNLPPCHMMCQFYVSNKELTCQMYQRSADVGLGLPFNIASYTVLTYILAKLSGLKPKKLIVIIGDAHIYANHFQSLEEQIQRTPFKSPSLIINPEKIFLKVEDFSIDDFSLENYLHHDSIQMDMIA
jgi:thymidylate synthase